jgi:hypothetical protein
VTRVPHARTAPPPALTYTSGDFWLGGPGVLRPVRVHIEAPHDGPVLAVQHDTGIHGVGASAATAVEDLKAALHDHLVLLAQEEVLSDELEHQLNWLRRHIRADA